MSPDKASRTSSFREDNDTYRGVGVNSGVVIS